MKAWELASIFLTYNRCNRCNRCWRRQMVTKYLYSTLVDVVNVEWKAKQAVHIEQRRPWYTIPSDKVSNASHTPIGLLLYWCSSDNGVNIHAEETISPNPQLAAEEELFAPIRTGTTTTTDILDFSQQAGEEGRTTVGSTWWELLKASTNHSRSKRLRFSWNTLISIERFWNLRRPSLRTYRIKLLKYNTYPRVLLVSLIFVEEGLVCFNPPRSRKLRTCL